ncbi:MAG: NAD(P)-dependent oxidoreductase [Bacteroidota bacterium]
MKIFITGGSGMLGQFLNIELGKHHDILTHFYNNPGNCRQFNHVQFPITDYKKLEEVFVNFNPEVVIHTAALSNNEKADQQAADVVYDVNVNATLQIAQLCGKYNAKLIYTSTDSVYAGYRDSYLKEDAKLIPVSLYAETKLMGEVKIKETFDNYLILRVALLVGLCLNHSINNFHKMYYKLKVGKTVNLYTDQFRSPFALHDAARLIRELAEKNISGETINFGGSERFSRYGIGEILCEEAGFDKNLLIKTTMEEAGLRYKVADVSLNIDKLKSFGVEPKSLREATREIINK